MKKRDIVLSVLFLACTLAMLLAVGCNRSESEANDKPEEPEARRVKVSIKKVEPTPIRDILILPGTTQPWHDVTVAADQAGRVEWVGPEEGSEVKKDELLVKVDVAALKAGLDNARANLRLAQELFKRRQALYGRKIISREALDQSQNTLEVNKGAVRQAEVNYKNGFIHSPVDGIVNHLYVDPGEFVAQGNPVVDVVNVDRIKIDVNVPELDVPFIKAGQPVMVRIDAYPDEKLMGLIDFVAYKADTATKTFRVKVLIENKDRRIRPGMIARVAFLKRTISDALVVPLFSIVDKGGERLVYVEKDGVAHARTIEIGVIEQDTIQITKGLEVGDNLIVTGQKDVQEGTPVLVVP